MFVRKQRDVAFMDSFIKTTFTVVNGLNLINYICSIIVNHSFSVISLFELFKYIISMVTLKSGIILDQNDDRPLKWANGPYPIQIHAEYIILMDLLKGSLTLAMGKCLWFSVKIKVCPSSLSSP